MAFALSILDQSPIAEGMTAAEALRNTIDLAALADELGFTRYWLAEHHGTVMLAGTSPEILIGPVAAATRHLRVGSGGVMLPHYSPLKVAETFGMLSALYPGRIDLAVGRAAGTDPMTAFALQRDRRHSPPDDFPEQLSELLAYVAGDFPQDHRFARVRSASASSLPHAELWLLGSSAQSGVWAAELGLPYAFADFIFPGGAAVARRYRETFRPRPALPAPKVIVAVWALCADTDDEAHRIASSARMAFAHFLAGTPIRVPPVETASQFLAAHPESAQEVNRRRRALIGSPDAVRAGLEAVAEEYGADEIMLVTITYDHAARRRSYQLLAETFSKT